MSRSRLLTESEVTDLVLRALELQQADQEQTESYRPAVTVESLESMAEELGIARRYLDAAMREREQPPVTSSWDGREFQAVIPEALLPYRYDWVLKALGPSTRETWAGAQGRDLKSKVRMGLFTAGARCRTHGGQTVLTLRPRLATMVLVSLFIVLTFVLVGGAMAESFRGMAASGLFMGLLLGGGIAALAFQQFFVRWQAKGAELIERLSMAREARHDDEQIARIVSRLRAADR